MMIISNRLMEALFKRDFEEKGKKPYLMKWGPGEGTTKEIGHTEALEDLELRYPWHWSHEVGGSTNKLYTIAQKAFIDDPIIIDYINKGVEVLCIVFS
jgi:hypothetical protein